MDQVPDQPYWPQSNEEEAVAALARGHGACERCGAEDGRRRSFMRVMSFLVFTRHMRYQAVLCPSCTAVVGLKELSISSLLGWWGIPWGLLTFGALWINVSSLLRSNLVGRMGAGVLLSGLLWGGAALFRGVEERHQERDFARRTGDLVNDKANAAYEEASRLVGEGRMEEALGAIRRAHAAAPHSATINSTYGFVELSLGHPDVARERLEAAVRANPEDLDSLYGLAIACSRVGDAPAAARHLRTLVEADVEELYVHEEYQGVCQLLGETEEPTAFYRERAQARPDSADAQYLLGRILPSPEEAAPPMRRALELDPELQPARVALIHHLIALRELDEARTLCEGLAPTDPEDLSDVVLPALVAYFDRRFDDALRILDGGLAAGRGTLFLHWQRSRAAGPALRFDDAWEDLQQVRRSPDLDAATEQVITIDEITLLIEAGRFDDARVALDEARASLTEPSDELLVQLAWLDGLLRWLRGDLQQAAETFAAAPRCETGVMSWRTLVLARGQVLALLGDLDGARTAWEELESTDDQDKSWEAGPTARMLLGRLSPEDYLVEARRSDFTYDNNAHFAVGLRHELEGRADEARAAYQRSIDTSYGHNYPWELARQALARLEADAPR